jgi:hypothetical protein
VVLSLGIEGEACARSILLLRKTSRSLSLPGMSTLASKPVADAANDYSYRVYIVDD